MGVSTYDVDGCTDDGSSCFTCIDSTTSDIPKLSPPPSQQTQTLRAPFDYLHTPIPMPETKPMLAQGNHPPRVQAASKDLEEDIASTLVHASCRLQEAATVATIACDRLIYQWSGLEPEAAASAARVAVGRQNKRTPDANVHMPDQAVVLQTLLTAIQLEVAAAGAVVGMSIHARTEALEHGRLHPISALAATESPTSVTATAAATFAAFTNGITTTTYLDGLSRGLVNMSFVVQGVELLASCWSVAIKTPIKTVWLSLLSGDAELRRARRAAQDLTAPGAATADRLLGLYDTITIRHVVTGAKRVQTLIDIAVAVAKWHRRSCWDTTGLKHRLRNLRKVVCGTQPSPADNSGYNNNNNNEDDDNEDINEILKRAQKACAHAMAAAQLLEERRRRLILRHITV